MKYLLSLTLFLSLATSAVHAQAAAVPDTGEKPAVEVEKEEAPAEEPKKEEEKPEAKKEPEKKDEAKAEPEKKADQAKADEPEADEPTTDEPTAKRAQPVNSDRDRILGWVEWAEIGRERLKMKARLDTGAKTSSLHAEDVSLFERDGAKWVRFVTISDDDVRTKMEQPLKRVARVKKASSEELEERYVVELEIAIADLHISDEFNLSSREHMNYPVLIGRNVLAKLGLVDARKSFIATEKVEH